MYTTLISAKELTHFSGDLRVFDCSADLTNPPAGREQFESQHIAGALFADINTDCPATTRPWPSMAVAIPCLHASTLPSGWDAWASGPPPKSWCMTAKA